MSETSEIYFFFLVKSKRNEKFELQQQKLSNPNQDQSSFKITGVLTEVLFEHTCKALERLLGWI